ncbi:MAG: Ca-activated chloride channel family protein [Arenicella sp.]|jgi:Ca-activated chloride channel family protein
MINWQSFHFIRPEWLYAIVPLLVLAILLSRLSSKQSGWQGIVSSHLYQHLVVAKDKKSRKPPFYLVALTWLIACVAMAGPTWQKLPQPVYQVSSGKVVVLDMSMSLRATDLQPDRLSRAKFKAIDLLNSLDEGEVGLVVYAGDAFTVSPLTADVSNITTLIPSLRPEIMPIPGSVPIYALEEAEMLLSAAGYNKGEVYWITDGIDLDDIRELQSHVAKSAYRYSILGVGTLNGAPIKMLDGGFLKDVSGNIILPALVSSYFNQVLGTSNGRYTPIQSDDSDIKNMQFTPLILKEDQVSNNIIGQGDQWQDMGAFLILLILPFAAYAFRRGVLVILISSFLIFPAEKSFANETSLANENPSVNKKPLTNRKQLTNKWYEKMFKNADQQGLQAFEKEDFDTASTTFDDAMWKGAALYRNKDYEAALESFIQVPGAESAYNQGNALAKLGQLETALEKYQEALSQSPDHTNAMANKKLVEELLKQQEEQKQDGEQQDGEDQQQGDSEKSDQQSGDPSQSDEQSGDPQDSQQQDGSPSDDQQDPQQDPSQKEEQQGSEQQSEEEKAQEAEKARAEQENAKDGDASEQKDTMQQQKPLEEMTPEEKEKMQRMQMLMNKVPDDPAYLLQRKMLLESQQRRAERFSKPNKKDW